MSPRIDSGVRLKHCSRTCRVWRCPSILRMWSSQFQRWSLARITTSTEGCRASSAMVLPVILDRILDAVEFSLRRTAWVSFQLSQRYRRVDVTEEFHRRMRSLDGSLASVSTLFRSLKRGQAIVTKNAVHCTVVGKTLSNTVAPLLIDALSCGTGMD